MKRILAVLCVITVLFSLAACSNTDLGVSDTKSDVTNNLSSDMNLDTPAENNAVTDTENQQKTQTEQPNTEEDDTMLKIEIVIGNKTFSALLYDNASAKAFTELLPITLNMSELNGNEKYYYLDSSLPTDSGRPSGIKAGDIMLYGNNCLVLFYESFSTSYSYTPLGRINEPEGLAAALGSGSVQVTFQNTSIN